MVELESAMARLGKSLRFEEEEIQDLLSLSYGDKRVFPLLSLLYPGMDFRNEFHIDHVFPRRRFTTRKLLQDGVPAADVEDFIVLMNQLPNLQLLEGPINHAKLDKLPNDWIGKQFPDQFARDTYVARHDRGVMPESIDAFSVFYGARQERIGRKLRSLLGISPTGDKSPSIT